MDGAANGSNRAQHTGLMLSSAVELCWVSRDIYSMQAQSESEACRMR